MRNIDSRCALLISVVMHIKILNDLECGRVGFHMSACKNHNFYDSLRRIVFKCYKMHFCLVYYKFYMHLLVNLMITAVKIII